MSLLYGSNLKTLKIPDVRPSRLRVSVVKPDASKKGTLRVRRYTGRSLRLAGKTVRVQGRRGVAAWAYAVAPGTKRKLALMAPQTILRLWYGVPDRWCDEDSVWNDPRAVTKIAVALAADVPTARLEVDYLRGISGRNDLREADNLLIVGSSFGPRPHGDGAEERWLQDAEAVQYQAIERLRPRDETRRTEPHVILWGAGDDHQLDVLHPDVRRYGSMDDLLRVLGRGARSAGRGLLPEGRLLKKAAPKAPFSVQSLQGNLQELITGDDASLRDLAAGIDGFNGEDFEDAMLESVRGDLGLGTLGGRRGGRTKFESFLDGLPSEFHRVVEEQRTRMRGVLCGKGVARLKRKTTRVSYSRDPRVLQELGFLFRERWRLLVPVCVRVLLIGLLARTLHPARRGLYYHLRQAGFRQDRRTWRRS
jgi:hypothetical protein